MSAPRRATSGSLIAASQVKGATVFNLAGERLGRIYDIMIDKASGRAIYAVMAIGGFLRMVENYHPLPWAILKYDADLIGYVVDLDKVKLGTAPSYASNVPFEWTRAYGNKVDGFYKTPTHWH